ncbi:hypothetical protein EC991_000677 [Linnemannia zychae]|nr:hypothetical protein EC991_000677 [Linnemannia zychae]
MKKAIRSFFGLKSKPKQDKNDSRDRDKYKDRPLEKTRTTTVSNSTLNSAVDPHRRSSNSNRPCVIVNEEPHDPQQHLQAASYRENSSCKLFTPLQPRPRPYSEFILNTRPRSATFTTTPNLCPPDVQAARRLYLYQPQKIDLGVGVGGPAPVAYAPQDNTGSSSYNISRLDQVKRSQSTRTPASASQAVYDNGDPHQIYHCVARSSPSTPPSLFTAQDRGCGISPHQKAEPDDGSSKLLLSSVFAEDSLDQLSSGGGDNDSQDLRHMNLAHNLVNLGSHSTDICVNPGERIEQEVASSRKVAMTCIGEDSGSICTNTTSHDIHHHDQQGQGYRHKERLYKVPQRLLPDLERALPPLPDPDPAPAAEPVSNTTTSDDSKKRSSLTSPTSAFILNKRPDSGVESSTAKKRTPSVKGKDVNRGGCGIQPNTPSAVSPYVRQFDLDVDKYMTNNSIPGLETHPYRVSLEHDLRVQARAYARGLAEERGSTQEEAVEKAKEDIADVEVNIAPFVSFEPLSAESSAQPQSIQPKAPQSRSTFSIKSSPHSQVATTPEVKRLSNNSRGSARRIIYSADLEQGLPKGHIARESNYEIVPTKRHSASSTRTHNTSSKSRGYTTHVATTADNLDGVPGGPALAAATLIIHPDNCGKAARVIMTVNSQESNNAVLQSLGSVSTKGSGVTDSEMGVPQQFMSTHLNHVRAVDSNALSFIAKKEREGVVYFGAERTASEPSGDQTNLASSASKAGM